MATYKVKCGAGNYQTDPEIKQILNYATKPQKTNSKIICSGALIPELATLSMECLTDVYHNEMGTHLRHSMLNFSPKDPITKNDVINIGKKAVQYYEDEYQILAAVHTDEDHLHLHLVMNTTNYNDGSKYKGRKQDLYAFQKHLKAILKPYGLSVNLVK